MALTRRGSVGYRSRRDADEARRAWIVAQIAELEPRVAELAKLSEQLAARKSELELIDAEREPLVQTWASGVEWFVVGAIVLVVGVGAALACLPLARARMNQTRSDAQAVRSGVLLYLGQKPVASCSTLSELRASRTIDHSRRITDAWDHEFAIACKGDDILVISAGPDGRFGTDDDIE